MTKGLIPCKNPELCGVRSHRPGTASKCKATGSGASQSATNRLGAAPKLASAKQDDVPVSGPELREFLKESVGLSHRMIDVMKRGSEQVEAGVRKELNLTEEDDDLVVLSNTLLSTVDRVTVLIGRQNRSVEQRRHIQRKSKYLPLHATEGQVSMDDIHELDRDTQNFEARKAKIAQKAQERIEEWVKSWTPSTDYDEVRTYPSNVVGDSEFISARLYRRGLEGRYYRIPRGAIFPE